MKDPKVEKFRYELLAQAYLAKYGPPKSKCFPPSKPSKFYFNGRVSPEKHVELGCRQELLDKFIKAREKKQKKKLKKIKREKKELKKLKREKKELKKAKMAETTQFDGDGVALKMLKLNEVEDSLAKVEEMELDGSTSEDVEQGQVMLPDIHVMSLMEGGLKLCAKAAEKKDVAHSKSD